MCCGRTPTGFDVIRIFKRKHARADFVLRFVKILTVRWRCYRIFSREYNSMLTHLSLTTLRIATQHIGRKVTQPMGLPASLGRVSQPKQRFEKRSAQEVSKPSKTEEHHNTCTRCSAYLSTEPALYESKSAEW